MVGSWTVLVIHAGMRSLPVPSAPTTCTFTFCPVSYTHLSVAPGRDIARLVEVAAMDYHLKDMGIDMAGEFNRRLMSNFQSSAN